MMLDPHILAGNPLACSNSSNSLYASCRFLGFSTASMNSMTSASFSFVFGSYMAHPSFLSDVVLQTMHSLFSFIPWHFIALAFRTKDGSGSVEGICVFVISNPGNHFIFIMTEIIPVEQQAERSFAVSKCCEFRTVIHECSNGNTAGNHRFRAGCFRR